MSACFVTAEGRYISISAYRFGDGGNKSSELLMNLFEAMNGAFMIDSL
jgi:dsRNA-specific ribonuclease